MTWIAPAPLKPSFCAVAAVRSYSRPPTYGPRSITGTRTIRPRWRIVTFVPHGSDLLATPSEPTPSVPPQPSLLPNRPGPYHEATTWFGGPAPDSAGVARLLSTFQFTDSPDGAALTPTSDLLVSQGDVALIGRNDHSTLIVRRSSDVLPTLPEWAGLPLPGGELWRTGRELDPGSAARVVGTPHQWRYVLAGDSTAMDLVLHGPESGKPPLPMGDDQLVGALSALRGLWKG